MNVNDKNIQNKTKIAHSKICYWLNIDRCKIFVKIFTCKIWFRINRLGKYRVHKTKFSIADAINIDVN